MPILKKYYKTNQAAEFLSINPAQLRGARVSGVLFGRPAPEFYKVGPRRVMYKLDDLIAFVESSPKSRITDAPEPEHLVEAREG